jgi:hypothetical protein
MRVLPLYLIAVAAASPLAAQQRPDFTGTWVLDTARSEHSTFNPLGTTYAVRQHGDSLVVDRTVISATNGTTQTHSVYGFDGKPWSNTLRLVGQETTASSVLSWRGDTLVIHSTSSPGGQELVQDDRWVLGADGTTLTMVREASYGGQVIGTPRWLLVRAAH